jgi:adenosyl cobinamide kinase/adenosyl cobinamide phosphate guanylyltransferase
LTTVESTDLPAIADAAVGTVVLVDCLALWLTAHLDDMDAWAAAERGDRPGISA